MDVSLNMIDLEYLTNRSFLKKSMLDDKVEADNKNFEIDLKFYRKRIFQLTKEFLTGKHIHAELKMSFLNYSKSCIKYFKFIVKLQLHTLICIISDHESNQKIIQNKELSIWEALIPIFALVGMLAYNVYVYGDDALSGSNQFVLLLFLAWYHLSYKPNHLHLFW